MFYRSEDILSITQNKKYTLPEYSTNIENIDGRFMINVIPIEYVKLTDSKFFNDEIYDCGYYDNTYERQDDVEYYIADEVSKYIPCMTRIGTIIVDETVLPTYNHISYYGNQSGDYLQYLKLQTNDCTSISQNSPVIQRFILKQ